MASKFHFERRGFADLYMDTHKLLREGLLDDEVPALDLSGSVVKSYSDFHFLKKFLALFRGAISLRLAECGLKGKLDWLVRFLTTWARNVQLDLSGNPIRLDDMIELLAALQTKVDQTEVSYCVVVGEGYPNLLTRPRNCHPHPHYGCFCRIPALHVGAEYSDVQASRPCAGFEIVEIILQPPGLLLSRPQAVIDIVGEIAFARQRQADLKEILLTEEEAAVANGRALAFDGKVWHICGDRYGGIAILDMRSYTSGHITDCLGGKVPRESIVSDITIERDGDTLLQANRFEAPAADPDNYLSTQGGEWIYVGFEAFTIECGRAWVSARLEENMKRLWFPLDCVNLALV